MTKTARDLRSAAHALRTAADALEETVTALRALSDALEETVTALRALSDDLNEPDPEPEPAPAWPSAPYVWWDGYLWEPPGDGRYVSVVGDLHSTDLANLDPEIRDEAIRFAREAVPVAIVPAADWAILRRCVEDEGAVWDAAEALVAATDALAQEVAQ